MRTFKFGLLRFVAPSNANASSAAACDDPISTLYPSACRAMMIPRTGSGGCGVYCWERFPSAASAISDKGRLGDKASTHPLESSFDPVPVLVALVHLAQQAGSRRCDPGRFRV